MTLPFWAELELRNRLLAAENAWEQAEGVANIWGMSKEDYLRQYIDRNFQPLTFTVASPE